MYEYCEFRKSVVPIILSESLTLSAVIARKGLLSRKWSCEAGLVEFDVDMCLLLFVEHFVSETPPLI